MHTKFMSENLRG